MLWRYRHYQYVTLFCDSCKNQGHDNPVAEFAVGTSSSCLRWDQYGSPIHMNLRAGCSLYLIPLSRHLWCGILASATHPPNCKQPCTARRTIPASSEEQHWRPFGRSSAGTGLARTANDTPRDLNADPSHLQTSPVAVVAVTPLPAASVHT